MHGHARDRQVVVAGEVEGESGTGKESAAVVVVLAVAQLIVAQRSVGILVVLLAQVAAAAPALAVAHVGKGIDYFRGVVDVAAHVPSYVIVDAGLHRSVVASLAVALQHDVDDAGCAFGRELGRGVVYHLNALNALGRYLLQDFATVVGGQSAGLAVDPYLHARIAAQRYLAVGGHFDGGDVLQQVGH